MKAISILACAGVLCGSAIAFSGPGGWPGTANSPQSEMRKADSQKADGQRTSSQQASGQQASTQLAFAQLKTLAGNWKGKAVMGHLGGKDIGAVYVSLRVTSGGAAIMHEMVPEGRSADPSDGDNDPITMLYMDGERLMLTHYCDSGKNRPRMTGKLSADGKKVEFDFLDVAGGTKFGHMHRAVFTFIDADHHTEDWTFMTPANQAGQAHIDLVREK